MKKTHPSERVQVQGVFVSILLEVYPSFFKLCYSNLEDHTLMATIVLLCAWRERGQGSSAKLLAFYYLTIRCCQFPHTGTLILLCVFVRDCSGDRPLQCYRSRAVDISSRTAHPHQEKESRGLVGGWAPGTQEQILRYTKKLSLHCPP